MKVVLSKKGFDSQYGKKPSVILVEDNNRMISFPIPIDSTRESGIGVDLLNVLGYSLKNIFEDLSIDTTYNHHVDPAIQGMVPEIDGTFGQSGAALGHLRKQKVGSGDLFLFYGTFSFAGRDTDNHLKYLPVHPFHAIWGYLKVDEVLEDMDRVNDPEYARLQIHPHFINRDKQGYKSGNSIFIGHDFGVFRFSEILRLTKLGYNKTYWELPHFFKNINISCNGNSAKHKETSVGFEIQVPSKSQEFVFELPEAERWWIENIIELKG